MKSVSTTIVAATVAACVAVTGAGAGVAHAAGTAAGTVIQNTATITFTTATGVTLAMQSTTNVVRVDQVVGVVVTPLLTSPVAIGSNAATLVYQVTNVGNGPDSFALTGTPNVAGDAFVTTLQTIAIDANGNGQYDPGTDSVVAQGAAGPVIAPDQSFRVLLVMTPPATAGDGQTSQVRLTATSQIGSGTPGTFLQGKGAGGVDAIVGLTSGTGTALESVQASTAQVALTKSAQIVDPYGGANPLSGSLVTYSITAHTTGSGTASNLVISDAFPAGTTYPPGTMTLNGVTLTDAADGDAGQATTTGIAVQLGNVPGGSADRTVSFKVKIN